MDALAGYDVNWSLRREALVDGRAATAAAADGATSWGRPVDVRVDRVVREFGGMAALRGVSIDIAGGELVALLGPSGSGKTTLLRILAGLDAPTAGRVTFAGEDALRLPVQQRHIGFVFQSYALFRNMKVFDNIAFGLTVRPFWRRPAKAEIRRRVMELLDLVQLSGLEDRYPSQLSGGQRQRVALARALAIEPRMLLLDEPFGALDAKVRRELRRWLREIHDRTGHTTVFVTHDQEEAIELADRIAILNNGQIEQVGTPGEIYDRPATPFVASFIGETNALPVEIAGGKLVLDGATLDISVGGATGGSHNLVFRPHDVKLCNGAGGGIAGRVVSERRHGASRRLDLEIEGRRHRVEIDVPPEIESAHRGDRVSFLPSRWWLFEA